MAVKPPPIIVKAVIYKDIDKFKVQSGRVFYFTDRDQMRAPKPLERLHVQIEVYRCRGRIFPTHKAAVRQIMGQDIGAAAPIIEI